MAAFEQTVRVGLIGAGSMGSDHAERIAHRCGGARLVAVADIDAARARTAVADIAGCRIEADPFALVAADDVDAILVATPGGAHEEILLACLDRDVPVLCEKPLTLDAESSLRVVESEVTLGHRRVQVGFMRRFDEDYIELKRVLDEATLGAPLILHCAHRAPSVPSWFSEEMLINDAVVHEFDVSRWLLNQDITAVSVLRPGKSRAGRPPPQLVLFETSGSVLVDVEIFVTCDFGYQVCCEAVCESGTIRIGDSCGPLVQHAGRWSGAVTQDFQSRFAHAYDREVQFWLESVRRGQADGPSVWDGYAAAAASEAGLKAQRTGQRTEVKLTDRPALYH